MTQFIKVPLKILDHALGLTLPFYATSQSAGLDVAAAIDAPIQLESLDRVLIPTGLTVALPKNFELQVRPRSGMALNHGITVLNSPGTIDADYRGEIKVLLINLSREIFKVERGMRIAQLVIQSTVQLRWHEQGVFDFTKRNDQGFGSTGMRERSADDS